MLGALFMASIVSICGYTRSFPDATVTFLSKLVLGCYLGLMVDRTTLQQLRKIVLPAILVSVWMLALSLVCGFLLFRVSDLPLETALSVPTAGGIAEMAMLDNLPCRYRYHYDSTARSGRPFLVLMPSLPAC
jgi:uncharacterized membrane protein AbrB (regulator of aidB expression)